MYGILENQIRAEIARDIKIEERFKEIEKEIGELKEWLASVSNSLDSSLSGIDGFREKISRKLDIADE